MYLDSLEYKGRHEETNRELTDEDERMFARFVDIVIDFRMNNMVGDENNAFHDGASLQLANQAHPSTGA